MSTFRDTQESPAEIGADVVDGAGAGLCVVELAAIVFAGLIVAPPLLVMAVVVVVPTAAVLAIVAVAYAVVALPVRLFSRARTHHRDHGSTLFLHRLTW